LNKQPGKHVIVGIGEVLWDLLPSGRQLGGAPANFAYHAQALGARSFVVSCVGNDEGGRDILARLAELGLDPRYVGVDGRHPTGTVDVQLDSSGKPTYIIHENVAWDHIRFNDGLAELAGRADAVCFGSLAQRSAGSRAAIGQFLKAVRADCLRVFDINLRQAYYSGEVVRESLALSNVLKLNDEELPIAAAMLGIRGTETEIVEEILGRFSLRALALTRGGRGSLLCTNEGRVEHPGYPVAAVADTVGAGDAFTAALTVGLLEGRKPDEIADFANRLAGYICTQHGATPRITENYPTYSSI
jgi:fructokinase